MSYLPHPIDLDKYNNPTDFCDTIPGEVLETLAKEAHLRWAKDRVREGWKWGPEDNDDEKTNFRLVPYEDLPESIKNENREQVMNAIRLADAFGYSVRHKADEKKKPKKANIEVKTWRYAEDKYWSKPYNNEDQPEYALPIILGLVAQDIDCSWDSVRDSLDGLMTEHFEEFEIYSRKKYTSLYILSALENPFERRVAEYLRSEYGARCIRVIPQDADSVSGLFVRSDDPAACIASSCFALIALWDGLSEKSGSKDGIRCCAVVGNTLCENRGIIPPVVGCEAPIGDTRPVFNIVLPSQYTESGAVKPYSIRDLLPHVLEVGQNWYYLDKRNNLKPVDYLDDYKKQHFLKTVKSTNAINKVITKPGIAKRIPVYDLLDEPVHGLNKSADAANMRFLRLDTLAMALQKSYKNKIIWLSWLAAIGLCAFAVISDMGDIINLHSAFAAGIGVISVVAICVALLLLFRSNSKKSSHNIAHNKIRLLSECMRVQTYWNAVGLSDHNADEGMDNRARIDQTYSQCALRGWKIIDEACGYYDEKKSPPVFIDANVYNWIGTTDSKTASQYTKAGTKHSQLNYSRDTSSTYQKKSKKDNTIKGVFTSSAVFLTIIVLILLIFKFVNATRSGEWSFNGFSSLLEPMYEAGFWGTVFECVTMVLISALPVIAGCRILYSSSRKALENTTRYRWLALQYQKLIWNYDRLSFEAMQLTDKHSIEDFRRINNEKNDILLTAGKVAVSEACSWSALMLDSDAESPF